MSLQGNDPDLVDQLYSSKDCHFRPSIAVKAIGLLLGRARTEMMRSRPNSVHILVVCSWNVKGDFVHQEMHATAELCQARTLQEIGSIAARHSHKPRVLRRFLEPEAMDRPMPRTAFQTYIHDDMPGPREIFKERLPDFKRTFCNDEALFTTLTLHAGEHGAHLCVNLRQPAHRADIFRYIYHYTHGGLYIDIKFGFKVNFDYLLEIMARDWGLAQKEQCQERGLGPTQEGKLPSEFLLMAIGIKKDHIFQGIIYGQPKHPLFMRAIAHAFSKDIFAKIANLEYMIFCKALWKFLKDDMREEPRVGWNISPTYGPVYLLQEKHSQQLKNKKDMGNDGHYFVTASNITVAYTRCWEWQKGFKGDPVANERRATTMSQSLPQAVAAAMDARRDLGPDEASITNNSFEDIMEAIRNERHYSDISAEDVMRCIPRDPPPNRRPFNAFQAAENTTPSIPNMSEETASDTSDGPPPWEQQVEVENMAEVKYQGPVTIHTMVDPVPGPSFEDQANALPKRDKIIQICQSDEMFTWMHALATILVINEKAVLGGLKVSEQLKVWQDRIRILKKPPWIFAPLNLCKTIENTAWAEAMTARPVMGTDGLLTIAIGDGPTYKVLPKITSYFGVIAALFKKLWDQPEMHETLETDDNFEIVASTIKAIYDQTCRSCGVINRLIIYMQKDGKQVRKMRIDHEVGDTPAKLRLLRPKLADKRHTEDTGPVSEKGRKTTGPTPIKHGMTARGGTLRTGDPHPARGAGIDSPP
ncbi:unnamed protein product [Symbiodinium microadriaticum]|nr:unnamed protein product [Symbiodinium microadriaticum]